MLFAALLALIPTVAPAQGVFVPPPDAASERGAPLTGLRAHVARQLPLFGFYDVDVRRLSTGQVVAINSVIHSGRSRGDVTGMIGGTLRRGLLQRGLDRLGGRS
jgi:hypothetical protein